MKRQIMLWNRCVSTCCPGHDTFPNETYKNRRSKKARARDIKREHRMVRRLERMAVRSMLNALDQD